jgi:ferric-dicitrate binding protein FerR (iron transport regulator)
MHSRNINTEAFDWVVRLERGLNHHEQSLLDRWLALDARCVGALARAQAYWAHVDAVRDFSRRTAARTPATRTSVTLRSIP